MSVYSQDLRQRVVKAYEDGEGSHVKLAQRFMINPATVRDWMKLKRTTGSLKAKPCGRKPQAIQPWQQRLTSLLKEDNDATLKELVERLEERYGVKTSKSAVDRWLKKLGITRKKRRSMMRKETVTELSG